MEQLVYGGGGALTAIEQAGFDGVLQYGEITRFRSEVKQPYADEPEDGGIARQDDFRKKRDLFPHQLFTLYWSIHKAKEYQVWGGPLGAIAFNWYPTGRKTWGIVRWAQVPCQLLWYRLFNHQKVDTYGTLPVWAGWDSEEARLANPTIPQYVFPSKRLIRWLIWWYKCVLGKYHAGFVWFVWQNDQQMFDDLSRHPEYWPVNGYKL